MKRNRSRTKPNARERITAILRERIVAGEHLGLLRPGTRLPSVRTLAAELAADPRTILAAYQELETEGIVELRPRSGAYLTAGTGSREPRIPWLGTWMIQVLGQGLARGLSAVELPDRMRRLLTSVRPRAACVECNDDQMAGLCEELRSDYGWETEPVSIAELSPAGAAEAFDGADVVVTTYFHASEMKSLAAAAGKTLITISLRPEFLAEMERLVAAGPVYFVARDRRFRKKLMRMLEDVHPAAQRPTVLIAGEDDLASIPPGVPVYMTQAARKIVGDLDEARAMVRTPRVFSAESAQELLEFTVAANLRAESGA